MESHRKFVMHNCEAHSSDESAAFPTLDAPRWQSVCVTMQVFRKKLLQLINKTATKKRPRAGAFDVPYVPRLRKILTKQLALRELERTAGLGATVLLALDHARVAGEETTLLQHAAQIRFEIGQGLGKTVADGSSLPRKPAAGQRQD